MSRKSVVLTIAAAVIATSAFAFGPAPFWPFGGHDLENTRNPSAAVMIGPENVGSLGVSWVFETGGGADCAVVLCDVSATASLDGTSVYVPDWAGNLFSLDRRTGAVNWSRTMADYTGVTGNFTRATPAIHGNMLIFGDQGGRFFQGATLIAADKHTGDSIWTTKIDDHPAAIVTQSPVVFGNRVYVGVASMEELFAVDPSYPCCTFRGSMVALDVNTGDIVWKTYMAPGITGYSGNSVWGPTAAVDPRRNSVFVATGNNYTVPDEELDCVATNEGDPDAIAACSEPDNYFDAVVSLDMTTGAVNWATKALPFDAWTVACIFGTGNCSSPSGPDLDFGEGPALFTIPNGGRPVDVVGAGQKSGQYWVLDRETGEVVWVTKAGPGGLLGGMIWGSATDGERIYTANANTQTLYAPTHQEWALVGGQTVKSGFWTAMDAATGEILWQTPDPVSAASTSGEYYATEGPTAVANGVVYGCAMDPEGHMYALDAATGDVLWSFASGASCNAGATVTDGQVFWGSGYGSLFGFLPGAGPNNKFYAFGLQ